MRRQFSRALLMILMPALFLPASGARAEEAAGGSEVYPMTEFTVHSLDGRLLDSKAMRGKVVLIDIWATWCSPCLFAMPELNRIYTDFRGRGLEMVGIAVDSPAEEVPKVAEKFGMTYPVVLWNQHLAERIKGIQTVPTYILIAPDWTIHKLYVGATNPKHLRREIEGMLGVEERPGSDGSLAPAHGG